MTRLDKPLKRELTLVPDPATRALAVGLSSSIVSGR